MTPLQELRKVFHEIGLLESAAELLAWDQEVMMPRKGEAHRASQLELLERIRHRMLNNPTTATVLEQSKPQTEEERAFMREARRVYARATAIPESLAASIARHSSESLEVWRKARQKNDFSLFAPALQTMLELKREYAAAIDSTIPAYAVLFADYEPFISISEVTKHFETIQQQIIPLLRKIASQNEPATDFLKQEVPHEKIEDLCRNIVRGLGFDFTRGRLDESVHPFSCFVGDTRITTRFSEGWISAILAAMHETGHALYDQGLPRDRFGFGLLSRARSLTIHESQSRIWENHVGLSREFWEFWLSDVNDLLSSPISLDELFHGMNRVHPTHIRVEADELTYPLHIILRFRIEQELLSGELSVSQAPERWNNLSEELLGIRPENDAQGILQDTHWAMGAFGYFPTYLLGSMLAAQLYAAAQNDIVNLEAAISEGRTEELLAWLAENIHCHGSLLTTNELIEEATQIPLRSDAYIGYLKEKYARLYTR